MIQWRSKDKIKWIAWREKFSWIRFIAKIRFSRINSPAYSCQMCEAVRGPLQKKKKKGKYRRKIVNTAEEDVSIMGRDICTFRCHVSRRMVRVAATRALVSLELSPFYRVTPRVVILGRTKLFFWKNRLQPYKGQRTMERETERDSVLKYFHCRSSCIFFLFPFKNIVLRVIENTKKNFPISGRRSRDTEDLYLHDNHELKYSTSLRTNCWKGVPWILNRFDKYLNELIEFSSCSVCFLRVKIWKEDLSVIDYGSKIFRSETKNSCAFLAQNWTTVEKLVKEEEEEENVKISRFYRL